MHEALGGEGVKPWASLKAELPRRPGSRCWPGPCVQSDFGTCPCPGLRAPNCEVVVPPFPVPGTARPNGSSWRLRSPSSAGPRCGSSNQASAGRGSASEAGVPEEVKFKRTPADAGGRGTRGEGGPAQPPPRSLASMIPGWPGSETRHSGSAATVPVPWSGGVGPADLVLGRGSGEAPGGCVLLLACRMEPNFRSHATAWVQSRASCEVSQPVLGSNAA